MGITIGINLMNGTGLSQGGVILPPPPPPPPVGSGSVLAEGWKFVESASRSEPDPVGNPEPVLVTRPGFDASGQPVSVIDTLIKTKLLRQGFPNGGTLLDDTVALSDFVYAGDTVAGASNGSARVYPRPVCAWVSEEHQFIAGTGVTLSLFVAHGYGRNGTPAAAVELIVSDGVSEARQMVSALTPVVMPLTGYTVPCYQATLDISALTDGEITADFIVYPHVGDAPFQASVDGQPYPAMTGVSTQLHYKDAADAVTRYVSVDAVSGTGSGVASADLATARAAPFNTIAAALGALSSAMGGTVSGGYVDLAANQDHVTSTALNGASVGNYPLRYVGQGSGATRARVLDNNTGNANYMTRRSRWENVIFKKAGGSSNVRLFATNADAQSNGAVHSHVISGCSFDRNGQSEDRAYFHDSGRVLLYDTDSNWSNGMAKVYSNYDCFLHLVGCSGIASSMVHHAIGSFCNGQLGLNNGASKRPRHFAPVIAYNRIETAGGTNNIKTDGYLCGPEGLATVGNVGAITTASGADDSVELFGSAPERAENVIWAHNTFAGGEHNGPRDNKQPLTPGELTLFMRGNIIRYNILNGDYDDAGTGFGQDGSRQRNWPQRFGVAWVYNMVQDARFGAVTYAPGSFYADTLGLGNFRGNPGGGQAVDFAVDASGSGSNNHAGGDYRLTGPNLGHVPRLPSAQVAYSFDIAGAPVPVDGTAVAGAHQEIV